MNDIPDGNDSVATHQSVMRYSFKSYRTHIRGVLSRPIEMSGVFFATATTLLAVGDVPTRFFQANAGYHLLSLLTISTFSAFIAITWEIRRYLNEVPAGFEHTPQLCQRLAHLQPLKWEFRLAQSLLAWKLAPLEKEWREILSNNVFIAASRTDGVESYIRLLQDQIDNALSMVETSKFLLLNKLPKAMTSTESANASPATILEAVESIERFYFETVNFERNTRSVIPPDGFERVHELQLGWGDPVRKAFHQLFVFLQSIIEADPKADSSIQFTIVFDEAPGLNEFDAEFARIQRELRN